MKVKVEYTYPDGKYNQHYESQIVEVNETEYSKEKIYDILSMSHTLLDEVQDTDVILWNQDYPDYQLTTEQFNNAADIRESGFSVDNVLQVARDIFGMKYLAITDNIGLVYSIYE